MKVLVTGGAGYLGTMVTQQLLRDGHNVRVLDILYHGRQPLYPFISNKNFNFIRGDIRDEATIKRAVKNIDAIVHLAAIVGDPDCDKSPALAETTNIEGTRLLAKAAKMHKVRKFIFISTCSNYGIVPQNRKFVTEETPLKPISLYARTKTLMEQELKKTLSSGLVILRLSTLFGLSFRPRFDLIINEFVARLMTISALKVYAPNTFRPYLHVYDAAKVISEVINISITSATVLNVGVTAQNYTKQEVLNEILLYLKATPQIEVMDTDPDPRNYQVDFGLLQQLIKFKPTYPLADGIQELVKGFEQELLVFDGGGDE